MSTRGYAAAAAVALSMSLAGCSGGGSQSPATVTVTATAPAASAAGTPSPAPSKPPAPAPPSTTAAPKPFALGVGSFGGLKLPATPASLLAAVKPLIGNPTKKVEGSGCELAGPDRTSVSYEWGDITVYGEAGPGEALKIDSWSIDGGSTPVPVTLPFGTSVGMKRPALAAALTGESIDTDHMFAEGDIFTKDLTWWSLDKPNTTVVRVTYNPHLCE